MHLRAVPFWPWALWNRWLQRTTGFWYPQGAAIAALAALAHRFQANPVLNLMSILLSCLLGLAPIERCTVTTCWNYCPQDVLQILYLVGKEEQIHERNHMGSNAHQECRKVFKSYQSLMCHASEMQTIADSTCARDGNWRHNCSNGKQQDHCICSGKSLANHRPFACGSHPRISQAPHVGTAFCNDRVVKCLIVRSTGQQDFFDSVCTFLS